MIRFIFVLLVSCGVADAGTLVARFTDNGDSYGTVVAKYDGQATNWVQLLWARGSNSGYCGVDSQPVGWVDEQTGEFELTIRGASGEVIGSYPPHEFPCLPVTTSTITTRHGAVNELVDNPDDRVGRTRRLQFTDVAWTRPGDSDLDELFTSSDLVLALQAGTYETGRFADWAAGDWNLDDVFDSSDLLAAFQEGGYEAGAAAVPEPTALVLLLIGVVIRLAARK